ncbi:hypothetical protein VNI00_011353 [Paramarasmius palmivorus]|uniref:Uncharacterized protein n=1 Tax=Paramarasmius palmivorus TaxID=297713 RepID=A0AAW0CDJ7_9AGAR
MASLDLHRGILNQEAQTVDQRGRIHVLNRENTTDTEQWYHYWRSPSPRMDWHRSPLPQALAEQSINNITRTPTVIGKRGKLVAPPKSDILLALLPNNAVNSTGLSILGSTAKKNFSDWKILWEVEEGNRWEVLFDRYRLAAGDGILSLFVVNGTEVGVLDLNVGL